MSKAHILGIAGIALAVLLWAWPAAAQIGEAAAGEKVAKAFGVQVLKVEGGEIDGRPVWLVTVMREGGNRNNAFQVSTLAVDQQSGDLMSSFRHGASGYTAPSAGPSGSTIENRPDVLRGRAWR